MQSRCRNPLAWLCNARMTGPPQGPPPLPSPVAEGGGPAASAGRRRASAGRPDPAGPGRPDRQAAAFLRSPRRRLQPPVPALIAARRVRRQNLCALGARSEAQPRPRKNARKGTPSERHPPQGLQKQPANLTRSAEAWHQRRRATRRRSEERTPEEQPSEEGDILGRRHRRRWRHMRNAARIPVQQHLLRLSRRRIEPQLPRLLAAQRARQAGDAIAARRPTGRAASVARETQGKGMHAYRAASVARFTKAAGQFDRVSGGLAPAPQGHAPAVRGTDAGGTASKEHPSEEGDILGRRHWRRWWHMRNAARIPVQQHLLRLSRSRIEPQLPRLLAAQRARQAGDAFAARRPTGRAGSVARERREKACTPTEWHPPRGSRKPPADLTGQRRLGTSTAGPRAGGQRNGIRRNSPQKKVTSSAAGTGGGGGTCGTLPASRFSSICCAFPDAG